MPKGSQPGVRNTVLGIYRHTADWEVTPGAWGKVVLLGCAVMEGSGRLMAKSNTRGRESRKPTEEERHGSQSPPP